MKISMIIAASLLALPQILVDSASAAVAARRSAVVVQGPYGGTAVVASRTAIRRPGYGFMASDDVKSSSANASEIKLTQHTADSDSNQKATPAVNHQGR